MTYETDLRAENATGVAFTLLTISHPQLTSDIRLSNDATAVKTDHPRTYHTVSRGNSFDYAPVSVTWPDDAPGASPKAQLKIADPFRTIEKLLLSLSLDDPARLLMEFVHSSDLDTARRALPNMDVAEAVGGADGFLSLNLSFDARDRARFPADTYTVATFPGVF